MDQNTFEKFLLGKCSPEEREAVEAWFMRHIDSDELDDMCLDMLGRMSSIHDQEQAMASYKELRKRLGFSRGSIWSHRYFRRGVAAALVAVGLGLAYYIGGAGHDAEAPLPDLAQISSPAQSTFTAMLPDSTTVVLRPGSRIVYDRNSFMSRRDLMLFGNAYFKVTKDAGRKFTVRCRDAAIEVLGTRFDVRSHDDDHEFEVALYDGSVKLASSFNYHSDTLLLHPGEIAKVDKSTGNLVTMKIDGLDAPAADGSLIFVDRPLSDILNTLRRRTGTTIILRNPTLGNVKFFAIFNGDEGIDRILSTLAKSEQMTISRVDDNTIEIK